MGSTSASYNASTAEITRQWYMPWGEVRSGSGALPTDYTYTGQKSEMDNLGLMYYVARHYDPSLGRFSQPDSIIPNPGDPASWNRYQYVKNSPLVYRDPSGHKECNDEMGCPGEGNNREPIPDSFVILEVSTTSSTIVTPGVSIASNAVLSHNHYLSPGESSSDIQSITITNANGDILFTASPDDFVYKGDELVGGGLSLFVFKDDFISSDSVAPLGDADNLAIGSMVQQSVVEGATPGLYPVTINSKYNPTNTRGRTYEALNVKPDWTVHGDSGAPLYKGGKVYGVNNSGSGIYGLVTNPSRIYDNIRSQTAFLRSRGR